MEITALYDLFAANPILKTTVETVRSGRANHLLLSGLYASARAISLKHIAQQCDSKVMLIVMAEQEKAQYMFADLQALSSSKAQSADTAIPAQAVNNILYFPTSHRRRQGTDEAMAIQRTEVLTALLHNETNIQGNNPYIKTIIVTYPEAMAEDTPKKSELKNATLHINAGDSYDMTILSKTLLESGFTRMDFVYEPGQYAVRGGIVDIFSYSNEEPYRLDFFGDQIESIRTFDIETQLSINKVSSMTVVGPASEDGSEQGTLTDYLPESTIGVSDDWSIVKWKTDSLNTDKPGGFHLPDHTIEIRDHSYFDNYTKFTFNTLPQPVFKKNFDLLENDIKEKLNQGYTVFILADQKKQTDRLQAIFTSEDAAIHDGNRTPVSFTAVDHTLHEGFIDKDCRYACYTDHEIFERYHRVTLKSENARRGKAVITLKEINQLRLGDYVVHQDHGIGQFGGLVTTTVNGKPQEMIKLTYRDGDTIYVSIHNLHRISKYKGREGSAPTISKLGSGTWERLKERTKDKVKDIARDLIQLYATRKEQKGFAYTPDGYMQHELEASFLYEDTPDQAKATLDVKHDMESPMPMDRLICGDVGFGKTEIAMRAAFKAATDGKQVAVLVPTTVLALQHYNTFRERFSNFPIKTEYLSRGKSKRDTDAILKDLKEGKIDILIGTHKLVSKQVIWKDLGLLIIDEEQKFGVAVKEKLKSLRTNVDVLTLTATPIPRTLQFSLLGARDLSIMTTPPQNRYPVQTEVLTPNDEDIIKEAIDTEIQRNGQVFVVNNRIDMLPRIAGRIHNLCPEARIVIAHGQMHADEMEKNLEDFINYDYDVLVSTTIIESGVDIPNVNTMIIYSAQHYGLADLHQLRGRVGRSNRKAYCYLIVPERELLTTDARRRLDAISTFAELGAGFNLAMQDLDIRGAGNLLGAEQSGFIADLGYDTYQRILNEAVTELKEEMMFNQTENSEMEKPTAWAGNTGISGNTWCNDSQLESDLPLCFPSEYVENISERITLYRELDGLSNENELLDFEKRLIDRFGSMPEDAKELLNVVRLRWLCCRLGIEKIYLKGERMTMYFITNNKDYWQSNTFGNILSYAINRPERCHIIEETDKKGQKTGKRKMSIMQVRTIGGAINLLSKIAG